MDSLAEPIHCDKSNEDLSHFSLSPVLPIILEQQSHSPSDYSTQIFADHTNFCGDLLG